MRQVVGTGLFLLFVFTMVGIYPAQWALRWMARREMKAMVHADGYDVEGLARLSFTLVRGEVMDRGFVWEEEDEFTFNDHLYDVVDIRTQGNVVTFLCLPDEDEDALVHCARMLDPFRHKHRSNTGGTQVLFKLITGLFAPCTAPGLEPDAHGVTMFAALDHAPLLAGFDRAPLRPPSA
jgi:hypothetical protein